VQATDFEFRYRFLIVSVFFFLGFACNAFDHVNAGAALLHLLPGRATRAGERWALQAVFAAGAALVALAALLRTWASAYLPSEIVHDARLRTEGLVADGPYRHVRNPLYLANIPMAMGIGLLASRTGFVALLLVNAIFVLRLIAREEEVLRVALGEAYLAYRAAVPRLLPSLRPRVPARGLEPRWGQALFGEMFLWIIAAGTAVFAITLRMNLFWILIALGLGTYGIVYAALRRRHPASA